VTTGRDGVQLPLLPVLYGLDIETDTTVDGLDPARSRVVAVAIAATDGDATVFTGDERALLKALDRWLRRARPGVLTTWNGAGFDLPFLADRAAALRVRLGLELAPDASIDSRHAPLTGHALPYRARWYRHLHLDACALYRVLLGPVDGGVERSFALKSVARDAGLVPVEVDRALIHELSADELRRYVTSDAVLARELAARRWLDAPPFVDALCLAS
jgi:hypothetical protein